MALNGRNIREQILGLLRRKDYRPLNKIDIARKLGLTGTERVAVRKSVRELERAGEIARIRKNRYVLPAEADLVTGKLSIHQAGYGFLTSEMPGQPDIFIAAENTGTAMHGDHVVARMSPDGPSGRIRGRREGRVIRILERSHDTIVGTLQRSRNFYYVVPDDPRIVHDVYVGQVSNSPQDESAVAELPLATFEVAPQVGDKVVVRLEAWESRHVNPEGEIIEVLGPASAPGIDMLSIIRKYHLPTEFPRDVLDQVKGIPETVDARHFDKRGNAKSARFARTVIRSARRLTYKQAYAILTAAPSDQLGERLHLAWELAALLRQRRFEHGALDLDFPEVKVWVDKDGHPVKLERVENDKSHQLIEEFMLAANEAVARELKKRVVQTIYRIHENPDPEKLAEFREFVLGFNYSVGDVTHRVELQRLLAAIRGKPEEQALKVGLLKSLKRARYSPQPLGHYGLAKANYLHFTSPIRRYADLV